MDSLSYKSQAKSLRQLALANGHARRADVAMRAVRPATERENAEYRAFINSLSGPRTKLGAERVRSALTEALWLVAGFAGGLVSVAVLGYVAYCWL